MSKTKTEQCQPRRLLQFVLVTSRTSPPYLAFLTFMLLLKVDAVDQFPQTYRRTLPMSGLVTSPGSPSLVNNASYAAASPTLNKEVADQRLKDRWEAFLAEASKEIGFNVDLSSPENVAAVAGQDLMIACGTTRPLRGRHRLSFMRLRDLALLFVGQDRHVRDPRFQVLHSRETPEVWSLQIRGAREGDSGSYECQINTEPQPKSRVVNLEVVAGHLWIVPPGTTQGGAAPGQTATGSSVQVQAGSQLNLDCVVDTGPIQPQYIMWYKDDRIIEYSDGMDAKITAHFNEPVESAAPSRESTDGTGGAWSSTGPTSPYRQHRSHLLVRNVSTRDSGHYRCGSDLTGEDSVRVFVTSDKGRGPTEGSLQLHQTDLPGDTRSLLSMQSSPPAIMSMSHMSCHGTSVPAFVVAALMTLKTSLLL